MNYLIFLILCKFFFFFSVFFFLARLIKALVVSFGSSLDITIAIVGKKLGWLPDHFAGVNT